MITLGKIIHPIDSTTITKSHLVRTNCFCSGTYFVCSEEDKTRGYMLVWYKFGTVLSRKAPFNLMMTLYDFGGLFVNFCENLQVVGVGDVPLHGVLDGVWAGEEVVASLLLVSTGVGVHVLVEEFPHVVGEVQNFEVLGVLESSLELLGNSSVVFWLPHDFADESLLAVQVIVVKLLIDILEHGDPLDDVHAIEESVGSRSILLVGTFCVGIVILIVVPVVVGTASSKNSASIYKVDNDTNKDQSTQECKTGGSA